MRRYNFGMDLTETDCSYADLERADNPEPTLLRLVSRNGIEVRVFSERAPQIKSLIEKYMFGQPKVSGTSKIHFFYSPSTPVSVSSQIPTLIVVNRKCGQISKKFLCATILWFQLLFSRASSTSRAIADYITMHPNLLTFKRGDIIQLVARDKVSSCFWSIQFCK